MGHIIPFYNDYHSRPEYQMALLETIGELEEMKVALQFLMVKLATTGKWKGWSDGILDGEVFDFKEEMLRNTGDPNIDAICAMVDQIQTLKNTIEIKL